MPNPTSLVRASPSLAFPGAARTSVAQPVPVHILARLAFWTILLLSLTNAIGVYVVSVRRAQDDNFEFSAYPIIFGLCTVIVLAFSKGRVRSAILVVAWVFWLSYFLCGFLGQSQITAENIRMTLRVTVKPWMAAVGLPWLGLRAISQDKVPRLLHITVVVICIGTVIGFFQVLVPGFMEGILAAESRAEGPWGIPGTMGAICGITVFFTLICPFNSRLMNWATRLILVAGVTATWSRGAIAALLVAWIVYAICARQFWTLLRSAIGLTVFWLVTLAVLKVTEVTTEIHEQQRLSSVRAFLSLEWRQNTLNDRTELWESGLNSILSKGGVLFGLGHGSMMRIVVTESQEIGPHNHYLYVLGNSGILALLSYLALHLVLVVKSSKLPDRQARAAVIAIAAVWAVYDLADNNLVDHPTFGGLFACVVVAVANARPAQSKRNRTALSVQARALSRQARMSTWQRVPVVPRA